MARRVFFSFHYDRDVFRVMQVRNSWVTRPNSEATPFYDAAEFEEVKRRAGGIQNWIEEQLRGTSVTVVLYGAQTSTRPWVLHEIRRSYELGKGLLAIDIHDIRDPRNGSDAAGTNPLSLVTVPNWGRNVPLSELRRSYNWVRDEGYANISAWIEEAARAAGR